MPGRPCGIAALIGSRGRACRRTGANANRLARPLTLIVPLHQPAAQQEHITATTICGRTIAVGAPTLRHIDYLASVITLCGLPTLLPTASFLPSPPRSFARASISRLWSRHLAADSGHRKRTPSFRSSWPSRDTSRRRAPAAQPSPPHRITPPTGRAMPPSSRSRGPLTGSRTSLSSRSTFCR